MKLIKLTLDGSRSFAKKVKTKPKAKNVVESVFSDCFDEFRARNPQKWRDQEYDSTEFKFERGQSQKDQPRKGQNKKGQAQEDKEKKPKRKLKSKGKEVSPESTPLPTKITFISSNNTHYNRFQVDDQPPVPTLANGLDRVLFSPGVHFLKDPRSNVYNFPPSLENIMSIRDFDFNKIPEFVPSGKDNKLSRLAQQQYKRYTGSTSSVTGILFQLHCALSHQRAPNIMGLSKYFGGWTTTFTKAQKMPSPFLLKYNDLTGTHAIAPIPTKINSDTVLSLLGHAMETMLVTDSDTFANYDRLKSHLLPKEEFQSTYNYLESGPFLFRSQLDSYDPRLPGTGYFDLKTRACCAVRHDIDYSQIKDGCDYQIYKRDGYEESYAREFFELVRTALFKYSLQARIGSMDGIFVAYHNINNLFGFEYLPLGDIDAIFHTSHLTKQHKANSLPQDLHEQTCRVGPLIAEKEFALSLGVLEQVLDKIIEHDPQQSYRVYIQSCGRSGLNVIYRKYDESEEDLTEDDKKPRFSHGFRVVLTSTINNKVVQGDQFPHIENENDVWEVTCEIDHLNRSDLNKVAKEMAEQYQPQVLQSTPSTSREDSDEEQEEAALSKLDEPTEFQERLRELQERGKKYRKWDEKREKVVWQPIRL